MTYHTHTLGNGLRILYIPHSSAVTYCGFEINAGTRDELPGEEGLAHFCEHISFKGTTHRRAWHIINCLESVGGDLNAFTNKENTVYHAAVLQEHVYRAAELLCDIVFNSIYPPAEIEKEVEVICDEIESYNDSPAELIYDRFEQMLFGAHSLGNNILGTAQGVRNFSSADAQRFTRRLYKAPNMVFYVYGSVDFKKLVRTLEKHTSHLPSVSFVPQNAFGNRVNDALPPYVAQEIELHMNTHQTHVMMGNRAYAMRHDRRIALYLLNNIVGGPGMNARLSVSLREKRGLVYSVDSSTVSYSDTGVWCVYFGCDPHDTQRCISLVHKELNKLIEGTLSPAQLQGAKKQLKGQIGVACDNRESFALDCGKSFLYDGDLKGVQQLFEEIDAVSATDLQSVAADIFSPQKLTTLIIK